MLTWSADMFAATYGAAGARCAALLAAPLAAAVPPPRSAAVAAAALYREMRCFTKAWAAAHPASIHTALSLVGFTDASGATFLADGPSPPIQPQDTAPLELTRAQVSTMIALRNDYLSRVCTLTPARAAALATLESALLGGDPARRAAVGRAECVAALDAADDVCASLEAQVEAEIMLRSASHTRPLTNSVGGGSRCATRAPPPSCPSSKPWPRGRGRPLQRLYWRGGGERW